MKDYSRYYASPDGEDAMGKMLYTNKLALFTGISFASIQSLMVSKPKGYAAIIGNYVHYTAPLVGMASTFTMVTYFATKLRGKDDPINYAIGGFAAGSIYGAWRRNVVSGCTMGLFFAIAGVIKKISVMEGWVFFPEATHPAYGGPNIQKNDYTLFAERPRNWTTGKE